MGREEADVMTQTPTDVGTAPPLPPGRPASQHRDWQVGGGDESHGCTTATGDWSAETTPPAALMGRYRWEGGGSKVAPGHAAAPGHRTASPPLCPRAALLWTQVCETSSASSVLLSGEQVPPWLVRTGTERPTVVGSGLGPAPCLSSVFPTNTGKSPLVKINTREPTPRHDALHEPQLCALTLPPVSPE